MKVMLKTDQKGLGKAGEIINAKDGYAMNYLLPRGLAVEATPAIMREVEAKNASLLHHAAELKQTAKENAAKIEGAVVEIKAKGGTSKLFGSVTTAEVASALAAVCGEQVDKKRITMPEIKTYGESSASVKLHPDVSASFTVKVIKDE